MTSGSIKTLKYQALYKKNTKTMKQNFEQVITYHVTLRALLRSTVRAQERQVKNSRYRATICSLTTLTMTCFYLNVPVYNDKQNRL